MNHVAAGAGTLERDVDDVDLQLAANDHGLQDLDERLSRIERALPASGKKAEERLPALAYPGGFRKFLTPDIAERIRPPRPVYDSEAIFSG